ncbi:hypothetical protein AVEN_140233-1 [Araneus ventricosus]|uniref:RNase H type-1 domain-containing protein n=1 Tax=Araneus ventricosus TaxID=182803 RepID=A0A4Y2I875_ARAVE|nr:hypothetical protein AVEN_140233-1 [Araneus ventricosus]
MAFNSIRGLQINVNHCEVAHTGVFQVAWDLKLDFIAIQDPYLVKGEPPRTNFGCKVFMSQSRKAILYILNKNFNVFFKFNTTSTVVVELHFNNFLLNIFNCYFPPNDHIEDLLNEWGGFNFLNSVNLFIGDFNCRSSSWGYDSDNYRGRKFMEFIASSNLHVCNISEYGPTFQSTINVGFPDLTLISSSIANYVKNWGVLDTETHSDHKFIYFNIEIDNIPETDFYFKSKYGQNKFMKYIKRHLGPLREKLKLANNTVHVNDLFNELTSMVQKGAFKTLKKKPKKLAKKFSFWNEDLRLTRNKVNKLFKIYRKHKAENSNVDLIQSSGNTYRRERAVFKKLLLKTKRKAWEDFCVNYNDRYGSLFKLVFNKSTGENSIGVSPNNDPNNSIVDRITHIMDFFFPGKSPDDNFVFNPIVGPISSLTIEDLEITFDFEVYTDGSRIEDETGFAVCIFQENNNIENHLYKLKSHNSVFQAELAAIHCAANRAASKNVSINIHTDSLSSIAAIKIASARSSFVNNIKQDLVKIKHLVGLCWVKAHVGIQGNELADQQAKLATTTGVDTIIPAPRSYVKRLLNKLMIKEWNDYWMQYNSTSGARVREYLEHTPLCASVGRWAMQIIIPLAARSLKNFHLVKLADAHKRAWFQNLINNSQTLNKLKEAFRISDSLTEAV